jgi:hypothetical protein
MAISTPFFSFKKRFFSQAFGVNFAELLLVIVCMRKMILFSLRLSQDL